MSATDAARRIGVSRQWVNKLVRNGQLSAVRVAGVHLLDRAEVEALADARAEAKRAAAREVSA